MTIIFGIAVGLVAYLIGSINTSIIISKLQGTDIRQHGSGNAGATNMLRTKGKLWGAVTLLCDLLKGVLAVIIAVNMSRLPQVADSNVMDIYKYIAGFLVVFGHNYPIFFGFKGGKGIATSAGVLLAVAWPLGLIALVSALLIMVITGYVSLGSICGGIIYPVVVFVYEYFFSKTEFSFGFLIFALLMGALAIFRHKENIKRLFAGTESNLRRKKV